MRSEPLHFAGYPQDCVVSAASVTQRPRSGDVHGRGRGVSLGIMSCLRETVRPHPGRARHFVLARSIRDPDELAGLTGVLDMPLRTVELTVPYPEIARRMAADPTAGRRDDLARTAEWIGSAVGSGLAERSVANDRPVRDVALDILGWLGWPMS
jgi:hypothetical protein